MLRTVFSTDPADADRLLHRSGVVAYWPSASIVSSAICGLHGQLRTGSAGKALLWAAAGAIFPVIAPTVAIVQALKDGYPRLSEEAAKLAAAETPIGQEPPTAAEIEAALRRYGVR